MWSQTNDTEKQTKKQLINSISEQNAERVSIISLSLSHSPILNRSPVKLRCCCLLLLSKTVYCCRYVTFREFRFIVLLVGQPKIESSCRNHNFVRRSTPIQKFNVNFRLSERCE